MKKHELHLSAPVRETCSAIYWNERQSRRKPEKVHVSTEPKQNEREGTLPISLSRQLPMSKAKRGNLVSYNDQRHPFDNVILMSRL